MLHVCLQYCKHQPAFRSAEVAWVSSVCCHLQAAAREQGESQLVSDAHSVGSFATAADVSFGQGALEEDDKTDMSHSSETEQQPNNSLPQQLKPCAQNSSTNSSSVISQGAASLTAAGSDSEQGKVQPSSLSPTAADNASEQGTVQPGAASSAANDTASGQKGAQPSAASVAPPDPQLSRALNEIQSTASNIAAVGQNNVQPHATGKTDDTAQAAVTRITSQSSFENPVSMQGLRMVQNRSAMVGMCAEDTVEAEVGEEQVLPAGAATDPLPWLIFAAAGLSTIALWLWHRPRQMHED